MKRVCNQDDCMEPVKALGLCRSHYLKDWRRKNAARKKAYDDAWRAAHRQEAREKFAAWRQANLERKADIDQAWREANKERQARNRRLWDERNRDRATENARRKRARKRAVHLADVDMDALWVRDSGTCQLCGEAIDRTLTWPNPMSLSLDHVVPLSRGGTHEPANAQIAHLSCNCAKGNRCA